MADTKIQWHPAFQAALQIELEDDREFLEFHEEYNLNKKPLQLDTLVISKKSGCSIQKTIGRIFKTYNIVEYKNPWDYICINDFHKVMVYACIYQANTNKVLEIPPEEITITLIGNRYPRKLIGYLISMGHVTVETVYPGIYYVLGLLFPLQIVISRQLPPEEYTWLSRLRDNLTLENDIDTLSIAYKGKDNDPLYSAVMEFIVRVNKKEYEEGLDMCQALEELFEGKLNDREAIGEARGEARGEIKTVVSQIRKKFEKNNTPLQAAEALELEESYVSLVMDMIQMNPDMDDVTIASELIKNRT